MVREANMKQAASEKQLKEAWGKVRPIPVCLGRPMAPVSQPMTPAMVLALRCTTLSKDMQQVPLRPSRHQEQENPGLRQVV